MPYHFIESGKKISDYDPLQWIFHQCGMMTIDVNPDDVVTLEKLKTGLDKFNDLDFLLIKTGFEQHRNHSSYWQLLFQMKLLII